MEFSGINFIQGNAPTATVQDNHMKSKDETGFKNVFSLLTNNGGHPMPEVLNEENLEGLSTLLQFLNTGDILDLEGGLEQLEQFLKTDQSLYSFLHEMIFPDGELEQLLQSLLATIEDKDHESLNELTGDEVLQALFTLLTQLNNIPQDQLKGKINDELVDFVKLAKYVQFLGEKEISPAEKKELESLLDSLKEKFQSLFNQRRNDERSAYLRSTFTKVVEELQQQTNRTKVEPVVKVEGGNGQAFFPPLTRGQQFPLTFYISQPQVNTADLMKQFESILARSQFSNIGGTQKLFIKLYPEHLGSLRIELLQGENGLLARILTSTQGAKEILETQLNALKQSFQTQNIQVDRIEIHQQLSHQERFLSKDGEESSHSGKENREEKNKDKKEGQSFTTTLDEMIVNMEA